jgi:hypothetical protein
MKTCIMDANKLYSMDENYPFALGNHGFPHNIALGQTAHLP